MGVVGAFGAIAGTEHAGLTAYWRADSVTEVNIADVLPILSKIDYYTAEYVIGEMLVWDSDVIRSEPNNAVMTRVMVYADGWIAAWFDKESQNQGSSSACSYVDAQTLGNIGSIITAYPNRYNGCILKVTSSSPTDPECPDDTVFCIRNTDSNDDQIQIHNDFFECPFPDDGHHFNTGYTYTIEIYQNNGNLVWWGHTSDSQAAPEASSNRLYRTIYEIWESLKYTLDLIGTTNTAITKAFLDEGGSFTDETTDFNDPGAGDVFLLPSIEVVNDAFYFGYEHKFTGLTLDMYENGIGNTIIWEYWDGSAWAYLTATDRTAGFTVSEVHIHENDDTTNTVASADATDQATLNILLNEIKADYNTHRVSTGFHDVADTTNAVTSSDATDLGTSIALANEIKADYNAHRTQSDVHPHDDDGNEVTSTNGNDLSTTMTLANEIKVDYNAHLVATEQVDTITFAPPTDWAKRVVNSSEQFWIRSRVVVAAYTRRPRLTQGWVIVPDPVDYSDTNIGLYSFEDTGAKYCLLCGVNTYTVYSAEDNAFFYNTSLPGKTVYKHSVSVGGRLVTASSSEYVRFYVNDKPINYLARYKVEQTYGYIVFDIKPFAGTAAVQNVFNCHGYVSASNRYAYGNMASVLITS